MAPTKIYGGLRPPPGLIRPPGGAVPWGTFPSQEKYPKVRLRGLAPP